MQCYEPEPRTRQRTQSASIFDTYHQLLIQRQLEEERQRKQREQQRTLEEEQQRTLEEEQQRTLEEEQQRTLEEEQQRTLEEEQQRTLEEEQQRTLEEEQQRTLEEQQKIEEERELEEKRQKKLEEKRKLEEIKRLEQLRRLEEEKKLELQKKLEEQKLELQRKLEEEKLEQQKKFEEEQKMEQKRKLERDQKLRNDKQYNGIKLKSLRTDGFQKKSSNPGTNVDNRGGIRLTRINAPTTYLTSKASIPTVHNSANTFKTATANTTNTKNKTHNPLLFVPVPLPIHRRNDRVTENSHSFSNEKTTWRGINPCMTLGVGRSSWHNVYPSMSTERPSAGGTNTRYSTTRGFRIGINNFDVNSRTHVRDEAETSFARNESQEPITRTNTYDADDEAFIDRTEFSKIEERSARFDNSGLRSQGYPPTIIRTEPTQNANNDRWDSGWTQPNNRLSHSNEQIYQSCSDNSEKGTMENGTNETQQSKRNGKCDECMFYTLCGCCMLFCNH